MLYAVLVLLPTLLSGGATQDAGPEVEPPIAFERAMDVERHLPQSSVYEILEDRRGFLWFATREGLGRWDSYTMRTWKTVPFDTTSLPANIVRQLLEDEHGDLWVRTEINDWTPGGIARLVGPDHERVMRYGFGDVRLFLGPDAEPWLAASDSLYRYDRTRDRFVGTEARISDARPVAGFTRRDGSVWVSTVEPALERYGPGTQQHRLVTPGSDWPTLNPGAPGALGSFYEDSEGRLWVGGAQLGRVSGDRIEQLSIPHTPIHSYGDGLGIGSIHEGDDDRLWLATLDGVYRVDPDAPERAERYSLRLPGDVATQNWVTALHRDRAGTLWAGTVWGLHHHMPYAKPFALLNHNPNDANTLGSGLVLSIEEDARGTLWVGTLGGGLNRVDPATGRVTRYRHRADDDATLSHDWVWSLASDGHALWIGTGEGVDRIDLDAPRTVERVVTKQTVGLPVAPWGPSANGLVIDAEGTLWFGYAGHLVRRSSGGALEFTPLPESVGIQSIVPVASGAWIATSLGLFRYDTASDTFHAYHHDPKDPTSLSHEAAISLLADRRGRLWVGTNSGLSRYDAATDGFHHITSADGLPSDVVYAMLEDDAGRLWLTTNRGLARLDPETGAIRAFTLADGIGNVEFNRNAHARGRDGTMYFGGDRGVTAFDPARVPDNPYRPPVVLTALHRSTRAGTETVHHLGREPVEIAPDEYTFTFEFAALNFTNPHHNRYAVMMEGFDMDWVDLGTNRRSTYTNLPPGRYTFRVKASNEDGVWNDSGAAIPVIVHPRFYQTWWFRFVLIGAVLGAVAAAGWSVSRRQYRRELTRLRARQALDAERARISRDMHDEVGASLTEIAILSEIAQRELGGSGDGVGTAAPSVARLSRIADTSRAMLDAIGEIIWAINPQHDRLDRLTAYLREHAARTLESAGLHAHLAFLPHVPDRPVTAEFRRNVFLVLKEALHNVIRHADARSVAVHLSLEEEVLLLVVEDDGRGFPDGNGSPMPESGRGGNGLGNMVHRAEEIGGTLDLDAASGDGTRLTLRAPLSPLHAIDAPPAARDV